jgi:hypothetical protein
MLFMVDKESANVMFGILAGSAIGITVWLVIITLIYSLL